MQSTEWSISANTRKHWGISWRIYKTSQITIISMLSTRSCGMFHDSQMRKYANIAKSLLALGLELPEETLVQQHNFNATGESSGNPLLSSTSVFYLPLDQLGSWNSEFQWVIHAMFVSGSTLASFPRSESEEEKTKNVWLKGHTGEERFTIPNGFVDLVDIDIGSITVLWSQPVGGLQILTPSGEWMWVKHIDNALVLSFSSCKTMHWHVYQVINAGDALEFLAGGFYPSTRHRVVQPPKDQKNVPRLGAFYFSMADDSVKLVPHIESPVLQRVGVQRLCPDDIAPTMEQWRRGRTTAYGQSILKQGKEKGVEEEVIEGVVVKHWNW